MTGPVQPAAGTATTLPGWLEDGDAPAPTPAPEALVLWEAVMFAVVAPLQETSLNVCPAAARCAKLWSERRQPSGDNDCAGINGPAAYESPSPTQ